MDIIEDEALVTIGILLDKVNRGGLTITSFEMSGVTAENVPGREELRVYGVESNKRTITIEFEVNE